MRVAESLTRIPKVLMNGTAQIISGFISFGSLHIHTTSFEPWQWLMIITGALTLVTAVAFWCVETRLDLGHEHWRKSPNLTNLIY